MSLGIDIGSKTIKAVELNKYGSDKFVLKSAGIIGYNGSEIEKINNDKDMASLAAIIKKLLQSSKISAKEVTICLPETSVFTRVIKYPLLTDPEVASAVEWEAADHIPIPVKEAVVEHQIIERRENATPPEVLVLLVATPKILVEKYIKVFSLAGLTVTAVETTLMAEARALSTAGQTYVLCDFGAKSADIAIVKDSQLVFSRSVQTAGDALTRAVAQSLGITLVQAEEYKRTYGLITEQLEGKVANSLMPFFRIIAEEIKKAINFYQVEEKGEAPTSLVLSGGSAGIPNITVVLAQLLGLEVVVANPFVNAKVSVDQNMSKSLTPYAPLYSAAVGLAMRSE